MGKANSAYNAFCAKISHAGMFALAGGAVYSSSSDVNFDGFTYIAHNSGFDGGEKGKEACFAPST